MRWDILQESLAMFFNKKYKPKILLEYNPGNMGQCGHSMEELNCLIDEINYIMHIKVSQLYLCLCIL